MPVQTSARLAGLTGSSGFSKGIHRNITKSKALGKTPFGTECANLPANLRQGWGWDAGSSIAWHGFSLGRL